MGICVVLDAIVAGIYFSRLSTMFTKFAFAAFFILIGVASKSPWLAEALSGDCWPFVVITATGVTLVVLFDLWRFTKRLERTNRRRRRYHRGSRRTTPARY